MDKAPNSADPHPHARRASRDTTEVCVVAPRGFGFWSPQPFPFPRLGHICHWSSRAMAGAVMAGATAYMASLSLRSSPFTEFNGLAAAPSFRPSIPAPTRSSEFFFLLWCNLIAETFFFMEWSWLQRWLGFLFSCTVQFIQAFLLEANLVGLPAQTAFLISQFLINPCSFVAGDVEGRGFEGSNPERIFEISS